MKALRIVGIGVALLGVAALVVVAAPTVWGQTASQRYVGQLRNVLGGTEIGVTVRDAEAADVQREKLPSATGAVVENVVAEGPAGKAGFKVGDVIVSFDGEKVRSARHLNRLIDETPDGREVEATIMRGGQRVALKVAPEPATMVRTYGLRNDLGRLKADLDNRLTVVPNITLPEMTYRYYSGDAWSSFWRSSFGVTVQDLTEQLGDYFGTRDGVLVTTVDENSTAKTAGIKAGDVITRVNGNLVRSSSDLQRQLRALTGEVTITLMRDRKEQTVKATVKDEPETLRRVIRRNL